jgi:hypothetical protein
MKKIVNKQLPKRFRIIKKIYCQIKIGPYFQCPFVLIQKNEKIKSLIILQCTPLLKNDQCSDLCELLYGAHISAPRRIDLFFQNNRRRKKILSIGLNYFTQIIFSPPEGDEGGGLSLLFLRAFESLSHLKKSRRTTLLPTS